MGAAAPFLVLMALAVLLWLLRPILSGASRDRRVTRGPSELDTLLRRKAILYANMKDLEFEHRMGKLSDADYNRLYEDDRAEAARILREIDTLEDRDDPDAIIEREIAARQAGRPAAPGGGALGARPEAEPSQPRAFCSACGANVAAADRFCSRCGVRLATESAT
jgi:hypothetical protein